MIDETTARKVARLLAGHGVRVVRAWRYGVRGTVLDDGAAYTLAIYTSGACSCTCGARARGAICAHLRALAAVASHDIEAALALGEPAEARTA